MNANIAEYHVPVNADVHDIKVIFVDEPDNIINPLGIKGVGEAGCIAVGAVVASGVEDALRPLCAAKFHHVPLTPSMIGEALEKAGH